MAELKSHPDVSELLDVLDANDLKKEKKDVISLVEYIGEMETTLSGMLEEMKGMKDEISKIHNSTLRAKCANLVQKTEGLIHKCISIVARAKDNLIQAAGNAVKAFKEKGRDALKKAVNAMRIPETLDRLAGAFKSMSESVRQNGKQLEGMQAELNIGRAHFKNAWRMFTGKQTETEVKVKTDRGILAGLGRLHGKLANGFSALAQKAMDKADKLRVDNVKDSVKSELSKLKNIAGDKSINVSDISRQGR